MDVKEIVAAALKELEPYKAEIANQVWNGIIHPELVKLEGQIGSAPLRTVTMAVDKIVDKLIDQKILDMAKEAGQDIKLIEG